MGVSKAVRLVDATTGKETRDIDLGLAVRCVAVSATGELIGAGAEDGTIVVWRAADGRETIRGMRGEPASSLAFSPDGAWLVAASALSVEVWGLPPGGK